MTVIPPNLYCLITTAAGQVVPIGTETHIPHMRGMSCQGLGVGELTAGASPDSYRCITAAAS